MKKDKPVRLPQKMDSVTIYEKLKEMIVSRELLPNQRLVEVEISKRFNVSRTPLREALRRLEAEGYVRYSKNRGAIVSYLTLQEIVDRFICFANLLAFASSLSVEYLSKRHIEELKNYDKKMRESTGEGERIQWVAYNQSFHITLISACPNNYLLTQLTKEGERLWRYWAGAFNMVFDLNEYHREHSDMINMAIKKDSDAIYSLIYAHIFRFSEKIKLIYGSVLHL